MAVTVQFYNKFFEYKGDNTIDMDNDTFKIILLTASHSFNGAHDVLADVNTNEIANGNGYATNGATLAGVTWTSTGAVAKFDANDPTWTASSGPIPASGGNIAHAVIYSSTAGKLVCSIDLDGSYSVLDTADFALRLDNSLGIFSEQEA